RVMAVASMHQTADGLALWNARDLLDDLVTTLRRYVMRASVVFEPNDEPVSARKIALNDGQIALNLAADTYATDARLAGVPTVHRATLEQFVPQMLNLDRLGGIDFTKGCYTGQEIVARTHNLGTIKRRMLAFDCANAKSLQPGDAMTSVAGDKIGQVVSAGADRVLAVVRLAALADERVAGDAHVAVGEVLELPYSIPEYDALR
ncbi:MAG: folate-binding protein YgfZ, partial [Gammaproteobacteria bacterium]